MKKMILMAAFAAFSFAVNAQNAPATASTSGTPTEKKECTNKSPLCCAKGTASTAAVTPEVKSVSKSKAKKACCAGAKSAACSEAKAEKKVVN
ncbi:MAG: hypothetical protein U5L45_07180 [Saprospiraceae bacterium]|nr:hypothetical protein [Saprospiraceae bacterium]